MGVSATIAELRDKLTALDQLDADRKIFAADHHQYRLNRPLPLRRVERIESLIGSRLPDQYRQFVTEFADGGAGPDYGILPLGGVLKADQNASWLASLTQPFPAPTTVRKMRKMDSNPGGILMVAEIGCGGHHWLVTAGPDRGFVWVNNPDGDWSPELSDESHIPEYSEAAGVDPIFKAALASPTSLKIEFMDWYAKWLDDSLREVSKPVRRSRNRA
jgi:hypothetical protein